MLTDMAESPNRTARDTGGALRDPIIREYADTQRAALELRVDAIVHRLRTRDVSDGGSRRLVDSMLRAKPYMLTPFRRPGMPNNSDGVERTIRHHVRPRSTRRILPDWAAAKNAGALRSIYVTGDMHGWIPGDILGGRRDASPF